MQTDNMAAARNLQLAFLKTLIPVYRTIRYRILEIFNLLSQYFLGIFFFLLICVLNVLSRFTPCIIYLFCLLRPTINNMCTIYLTLFTIGHTGMCVSSLKTVYSQLKLLYSY
jgi:hypothetical protein